MRINGRTLRASNVAERRLLRILGIESLHVPRRENPFRVARQIEQIVRRQHKETSYLRGLVRTNHKPHEPQPSPGLDLPQHDHEQDDAVAT